MYKNCKSKQPNSGGEFYEEFCKIWSVYGFAICVYFASGVPSE